ncbi:MAG TPA: site-2 protease family protein [Polyangiaceae bacterium]|jgi:membrane-associated protease RseP (regulator of RpoE activity)|nr:site-2 protease family protein [Polyangiaceae bacterium]
MTDSQQIHTHDGDLDGDVPPRYGLNLLLFVLTALSVFWTGAALGDASLADSLDPRRLLEIWRGWPFAVPLLAILIAHESGHYIAARVHNVPASLPFFIPLPKLSPFGTMGAIIGMSGRIRSRIALLDIGAAGPLAGMVVALPVLAFGLSWSHIAPNPEHYWQEGQSLLYLLMKRIFVGPIPDGEDVQLHPTANAGWVGLLVTMINMLPWGQLDGGHIAYALLGERQNALARWVRSSLLILFFYNVTKFCLPVLLHKSSQSIGYALSTSLFWLMWFGVTGIIGYVSGGTDHPPFEPGELGRGRRAVAWLCLIMFALLFMPTPQAVY